MFAGTVPFFVSQYPRAVLAVLTGTAAFIMAVIATLIHGTGPSVPLDGRVFLFSVTLVCAVMAFRLSGVGISFHGSHRVMTENAQFAMPEVGIGFFPDVGGSHLLPDLGGSFGMYLALTGNRIRYGDALWSGLATHTIRAEDQAGLLDELAVSGDPESELRGFFFPAKRETDRPTLAAISRHFAQASLSDVIDSLERAAAADEFAAKTLATIRTRSPTSLHVAWRQISAGLTLSMDECMKMEFRILNRMLAGRDFYEGIRAVIIDKGSKPHWQPASIDAVGTADIDAYFAPLERELEL
jgi:enoyl-CoA hydratase/carnithine racemase